MCHAGSLVEMHRHSSRDAVSVVAPLHLSSPTRDRSIVPHIASRLFFKRFICLFAFAILFGLGLCYRTHGAFLVVVSGGYALVAADKLLIAMTTLVAEHRL